MENIKKPVAMARHWCFTINNPVETPDELIELFIGKKVRYLVFQKEKGESETPHYQGYAEFSSPQRLAGCKKIHGTAHWEPRHSSRDNARNYCIKEESRIEGPWEYGEWNTRGQGSRSDLAELYKTARTSKTLLEVAEACPSSYMRYYKAVQHVRQIQAFDKPLRSTELQVILYYGPPGCGKTRRAYEEAPDLYAIPLGKQLWFDNYAGEPEVLVDDFSGNLRLVDTLRLFDRYPIQVPVKGGHVWWCPNIVYVTSNVHPRNWYDYSTRADSYQALTRRFTKVIEFRPDNNNIIYEKDEVINFFN